MFATFKVRSCNCSGLRFPSIRACDLKLFVCFRALAVCSACYIGETNRNFTTPIREHLYPNKHSNEKGPSAWGNVSKSLSRLPQWFLIKNQRSLKIKKPCTTFGIFKFPRLPIPIPFILIIYISKDNIFIFVFSFAP